MITWFDVENKVAELEKKSDFHEKIVHYLYDWIRELQENDEKDVQIQRLTSDLEISQNEVDDLQEQINDLKSEIKFE